MVTIAKKEKTKNQIKFCKELLVFWGLPKLSILKLKEPPSLLGIRVKIRKIRIKQQIVRVIFSILK